MIDTSGRAAAMHSRSSARVSVTCHQAGPLRALANARRNIRFEIVDTH